MKRPAFQCLFWSSYAIQVHCANVMALIEVSCTSQKLPGALPKPSKKKKKDHTLNFASVYPHLGVHLLPLVALR